MVTITKEQLDAVIKYIENMEVTVDGEWGSCRELEELLEDDDMPELYHQLKAIQLSLKDETK